MGSLRQKPRQRVLDAPAGSPVFCLYRESGTPPGYPLKETAGKFESWAARPRKGARGPSLNARDSAPSEGELLKGLEELAQLELGGPVQSSCYGSHVHLRWREQEDPLAFRNEVTSWLHTDSPLQGSLSLTLPPSCLEGEGQTGSEWPQGREERAFPGR